jgi:hypothetical protein
MGGSGSFVREFRCRSVWSGMFRKCFAWMMAMELMATKTEWFLCHCFLLNRFNLLKLPQASCRKAPNIHHLTFAIVRIFTLRSTKERMKNILQKLEKVCFYHLQHIKIPLLSIQFKNLSVPQWEQRKINDVVKSNMKRNWTTR